MPYIDPKDRWRLDHGLSMPKVPGELNYAITRLINEYISALGGANYTLLNEVVGVLECAKLELYRRIAVPYEEVKLSANGDVYTI